MISKTKTDPTPTRGEVDALRDALLAVMEKQKEIRARHAALSESLRRLRRAAGVREAELLGENALPTLAARRAASEHGLPAKEQELAAVEDALIALDDEEVRARATWRGVRDRARRAHLARLGAAQRALDAQIRARARDAVAPFVREATALRSEAERWARDTDGQPNVEGERFPGSTTATGLVRHVLWAYGDIDGGA